MMRSTALSHKGTEHAHAVFIERTDCLKPAAYRNTSLLTRRDIDNTTNIEKNDVYSVLGGEIQLRPQIPGPVA